MWCKVSLQEFCASGMYTELGQANSEQQHQWTGKSNSTRSSYKSLTDFNFPNHHGLKTCGIYFGSGQVSLSPSFAGPMAVILRVGLLSPRPDRRRWEHRVASWRLGLAWQFILFQGWLARNMSLLSFHIFITFSLLSNFLRRSYGPGHSRNSLLEKSRNLAFLKLFCAPSPRNTLSFRGSLPMGTENGSELAQCSTL